MRTIEQLNTLLEELEKRIRSISTAQKTLNQINEILAYIQDVQDYLQQLQTTFDSHVQECDDYSNDIANLQTQIDTINQTINNLNTDNETTNQLKTSLSELQTKVDEFIGNSSTTAETLQNDISALQTDLGSCQDDITDIESEISAINSSIGEHTTTITNLQTTQTNLQTTQSSQASTINNINSRLTTCENNVSTLTGGVDLAEYENRLSSLEPVNNLFQSYVHKHYDFHNASPKNFTLYTREYTYTCKPNAFVYQEFRIAYNFEGEGMMTVELFENNEATGEIYTIDLAQNPSQCVLHRTFCSATRSHNIMLKCVATSAITYKTVDITMHGQEIFIFEDNQDLKVACFNNNIYITRYYDDHIKYGKFASTDTIDIDNLPNSRPYNDVHGYHNYIMFAPFPRCDHPYTAYTKINDEFMLKVTHKNHFIACPASQELTNASADRTNELHSYSNDFLPALYAYSYMPTITNSIVVYKTLDINGLTYDQNYVKIDGVTEWLYCNAVKCNYQTSEDEPFLPKNMATVALADDGNFYLLFGRQTYSPYYYKVCKGGIYATGYIQQDETINAYISFGNYVEHYQILKNSNGKYKICNFIKKIEDCLCVYELFNGNLLKKTKSGWILDEQITITPEETATE